MPINALNAFQLLIWCQPGEGCLEKKMHEAGLLGKNCVSVQYLSNVLASGEIFLGSNSTERALPDLDPYAPKCVTGLCLESFLSFHLYVGPGDQTHDTGIHSKPLYPLIHLITLLDCIWEVQHHIRVFCDLVRKVCPGRSLVASSGGNCQVFPGLSFLIWRKGPSTLFLQHLM